MKMDNNFDIMSNECHNSFSTQIDNDVKTKIDISKLKIKIAKNVAKKTKYEAKKAEYEYNQLTCCAVKIQTNKNEDIDSSNKKEHSYLKRLGEAIIKNAPKIIISVVTAVAGCIAKVLTAKYRSSALA